MSVTSQRPSSRSQTSTPGDQPLSRTNLYIRGLATTTTDQDLLDLCAQYGNIASTKAVVDLSTKQCKGYGFVDFKDEESASNALNGLLARKYQAQMAKQQELDPTNLFFENLPPYHDEKHIADLLSDHQCGPVISTRVRRRADGISMCQGFARLSSRALCEQAIAALNDKFVVEGHPLPLIVRFAECTHKKTRQSPGTLPHFNHSDATQFSGLPLAMGSQQAALMAASGLNPFSMQAPVPPSLSSTGAPSLLPGYPVPVSHSHPSGMYPFHTLPPTSPYHTPPYPSPLNAHPAFMASAGLTATPSISHSMGASHGLTHSPLGANHLTANPLTANPLTANHLTANSLTANPVTANPLMMQYCHRHLTQRYNTCAPQMIHAPMPSSMPFMLDPSQAPPTM